jgi:hypothetical protein
MLSERHNMQVPGTATMPKGAWQHCVARGEFLLFLAGGRRNAAVPATLHQHGEKN